jgi:multidrug efflux pump subunit AcrA (membrane-fusion protein)
MEIATIGVENQGVVDFTVTMELSDPDAGVRPGMTSEVEIVVSQRDSTLLVPNQSVIYEQGVQVVYVMGTEGITPVEVELGASSDSHSELLSGELNIGDQIVLNPSVLDASPDEDGLPFTPGSGPGRMFVDDGEQP